MMSLSVAQRINAASKPPVKVTITFHNLRPGFVSAWDSARSNYGAEKFDALDRDAQIAAVRSYVNR